MALSAPQSPKSSPTNLTRPATHLSPSHLRVYYDDIGRCRSLSPRRMASIAAPVQVRKKLTDYNTIDDAAKLLKGARNVMVLSGAGISTSVGIPDFRGNEGIYNTTKSEIFANTQDIFELDNFKQYPDEFYKVVRKIVPRLNYYQAKDGHIEASSKVAAVPKFGSVHAFLKLLQDNDKLLTTYTQNIDGLEKVAGVDGAKIINCHGTWDSATCLTCGGRADSDSYLQAVIKGLLPLCDCSLPASKPTTNRRSNERRKARPKEAVNTEAFTYLKTDPTDRAVRRSINKNQTSPSKKRKRTSSDDEDDDGGDIPPSVPGLLKPSIVFFGEDIFDYKEKLKEHQKAVDLLLIIGTSLSVKPVSELPFKLPAGVPQIWISNQPLKHKSLTVDVELIGKCDLVVEELCARAGWATKLKNRVWFNNLGSRMQAKSVVRAKPGGPNPQPDKTSVVDGTSSNKGRAALCVPQEKLVSQPPDARAPNTKAFSGQLLPSPFPTPTPKAEETLKVPSIKVENPTTAFELPLRSPTHVAFAPGAEMLSPLTPETSRSSALSSQGAGDEQSSFDAASPAQSILTQDASPTKQEPHRQRPSESRELKGLPGLRIEQDELQDWKWYIRQRLAATKKASP